MTSKTTYVNDLNKVSALKEFFKDAFDEVLKAIPPAVLLFRTKVVSKKSGKSVIVEDFDRDWKYVASFIENWNARKQNDVYFAMTALDKQKLEARTKDLSKVVEVKGDAIDKTKLLVVDVDVDEFCVNGKVVFKHADKFIDPAFLDEIVKAKEEIAGKIVEFFANAKVTPYAVFDTGGGLQTWIVFNELIDVEKALQLGSKLVKALNHYLEQELPDIVKAKADDIYAWAEHIVRVPGTTNWGYKDRNGNVVPLRGRVLFADMEFASFEKIEQFVDEYLTEHNIPVNINNKENYGGVDEIRRRELTKVMYKINNVDDEELANALFEKLKQVFDDIAKKGYSRHDFWLALSAFFVRHTDISAEKLLKVSRLLFDKLVEAGLEDRADWSNRLSAIKATIKKFNANKVVATIRYLTEGAVAKKYSEEDAKAYFNAVHQALSRWRIRTSGQSAEKRLSSFEFDKLSDEEKKFVATHYLAQFYLEGKSYARLLSEFSAPFKLRYTKSGAVNKSDENNLRKLINTMLNTLGFEEFDADTPIMREEFEDAVVERDLVDYEVLKSIMLQHVYDVIELRSLVRVPKCIYRIIKKIIEEGKVSPMEWQHLLVFIKNYVDVSPPLPLVIKLGKSARLYLAIAIGEWFLDESVDADALSKITKHIIENDVEFECSTNDPYTAKKECPLKSTLGLSEKEIRDYCPFLYPTSSDLAVLLIKEATFYKDTKKLELVLLTNKRVSISVDKDSIEFVKTTKKSTKYPLAEVVLRALELEGINIFGKKDDVLQTLTHVLKTKLKTKYEIDLSAEFKEYLANIVMRGDVLDDFAEYTSTKLEKLIKDDKYYYIPVIVVNRFRERLEEEGVSISKRELRNALFASTAAVDFDLTYISAEGKKMHVRGVKVPRKFIDSFLSLPASSLSQQGPQQQPQEQGCSAGCVELGQTSTRTIDNNGSNNNSSNNSSSSELDDFFEGGGAE